ncbi:MAG: TetR/AcrR family transcriptional regulator [Clostridia bacterium]|nr:TetR/AcrR family transcriptional regulator [Clostridia bacterium]
MQILKDDIKQKIIEVSKRHFHKRGFEHTSMNDIASDVGISTGNIYRYFKTKNQILNDILKKIEDRMENVLKAITESSIKENYETIFHTLSEEIVKLASEEGESLQVLFHCGEMKQFNDFRERIVSTIASAIEKNSKNEKINAPVREALALSLFDGFANIVKDANNNIEELRNNLKTYSDVMVKNINLE